MVGCAPGCHWMSLDVRCCWLDLRARDLEAGALGGRTVLGWSKMVEVFGGLVPPLFLKA